MEKESSVITEEMQDKSGDPEHIVGTCRQCKVVTEGLNENKVCLQCLFVNGIKAVFPKRKRRTAKTTEVVKVQVRRMHPTIGNSARKEV